MITTHRLVVNLIASLDLMLQVGGADYLETAETNSGEFKGNDCVFVAEWLKTKGLHKLNVPYLKAFNDDLHLIVFKKMAHGM